jgi:hypothetical protein
LRDKCPGVLLCITVPVLPGQKERFKVAAGAGGLVDGGGIVIAEFVQAIRRLKYGRTVSAMNRAAKRKFQTLSLK